MNDVLADRARVLAERYVLRDSRLYGSLPGLMTDDNQLDMAEHDDP
jgi:hypothetical protein